MIQFLDAATGTATTAEMLISFLPMILIIVFMVVLIYLPQKRQDKKDAAMRSSIEIGDKVGCFTRIPLTLKLPGRFIYGESMNT